MQTTVSIVTAVSSDEQVPRFERLVERAAGVGSMREFVVVCHGVSNDAALQLTRIIQDVPDATLHFLPESVSEDHALLIGLDNAIGSVCLVASLEEMFDAAWGEAVDKVTSGYDLVLTRVNKGRTRSPSIYNLARRLFLWVYTLLTGARLDAGVCRTRAMSRSAVQYLLGRRDAEMLTSAPDLGLAFTAATIAVDPVDVPEQTRSRTFKGGIAKAYRSLARSVAIPVRGIVWLSLLAAVLNVLYTGYVFASYLWKDDIAPGWTTLSLQMSLGFLLIALVMSIMGELIISIDRGINYRLRYFVQREVRSPKSRWIKLRNVDFGTSGEPAGSSGADAR